VGWRLASDIGDSFDGNIGRRRNRNHDGLDSQSSHDFWHIGDGAEDRNTLDRHSSFVRIVISEGNRPEIPAPISTHFIEQDYATVAGADN
jgi:hypothetical protein